MSVLGGVFLAFGVLLALVVLRVLYVLGSFVRKAGKPPETPLEHALDRTAKRYEKVAQKKGEYYFVRGKLAGDPATEALVSLGHLGSVLDLGCGRGQLAVLLLEAGLAERARGLDWDPEKVRLAREAAAGLEATFEEGDVRKAHEKAGGLSSTVLLVDVLHYFEKPVQDALLSQAADLVLPGGRLVVREADKGRGVRSFATRLQEGIGTRAKVNRGEQVLFRDVRRELVPLLEAKGFSCEVRPCWGLTPFSNVMLVATRAGRS